MQSKKKENHKMCREERREEERSGAEQSGEERRGEERRETRRRAETRVKERERREGQTDRQSDRQAGRQGGREAGQRKIKRCGERERIMSPAQSEHFARLAHVDAVIHCTLFVSDARVATACVWILWLF